MQDTLLLDPVRILRGPGIPLQQGAVLIEAGILTGFDEEARQRGTALGLTPTFSPEQLVAPCLVDPHSLLPNPINGMVETLTSLRRCAAGQCDFHPRGRR